MKNLIDFALKEKYYNVKKLRSRLEDMKSIMIGILSSNYCQIMNQAEEGMNTIKYS